MCYRPSIVVANAFHLGHIDVVNKVLTQIAPDNIPAFFPHRDNFDRLASGDQVLRVLSSQFGNG